jgi:hypothetical protein
VSSLPGVAVGVAHLAELLAVVNTNRNVAQLATLTACSSLVRVRSANVFGGGVQLHFQLLAIG